MNYIKSPNIPDRPVSAAVVDARISKEAEKKLIGLGIRLFKVQPHPGLYDAVSCHPDMMLHHIGGETIVYAPGTDERLIGQLKDNGFKLLKGEAELSATYPKDIAYNAARVGKWYFHNLKHTDPIVKKLLESLGIEPVHVEQGYSKCSVLPIDQNSIITSDIGIAKIAEKKGLDVLQVADERSIRLPGLNCGFIGGAGGMLNKSVLGINGRLGTLSLSEDIASFLSRKNIVLEELSDSVVTDIGSILPLKTYNI